MMIKGGIMVEIQVAQQKGLDRLAAPVETPGREVLPKTPERTEPEPRFTPPPPEQQPETPGIDPDHGRPKCSI
jgi:hypothetical protein